MPQFHETGFGKTFFGVQLPQLTRAIEKVGTELEKQNAEAALAQKTTDTVDDHLARLVVAVFDQYDIDFSAFTEKHGLPIGEVRMLVNMAKEMTA